MIERRTERCRRMCQQCSTVFVARNNIKRNDISARRQIRKGNGIKSARRRSTSVKNQCWQQNCKKNIFYIHPVTQFPFWWSLSLILLLCFIEAAAAVCCTFYVLSYVVDNFFLQWIIWQEKNYNFFAKNYTSGLTYGTTGVLICEINKQNIIFNIKVYCFDNLCIFCIKKPPQKLIPMLKF